jgi:hypothetical protein
MIPPRVYALMPGLKKVSDYSISSGLLWELMTNIKSS